jgi:hypothetical protein
MTNQLTCRNGEIGKLTSRDVTFNRSLACIIRFMSGVLHTVGHKLQVETK